MKKFTSICFIFILARLWFNVEADCSCSCSSSNNPQLKQCVFKNINDDKDVGNVRSCHFNKVQDKTALRVTFQGTVRVIGCSAGCCRRWFITINGNECSSPAAIDTLVYADGTVNRHVPGTLDGFCNNIPKGKVNVGISIGACVAITAGDGYTGWNSVSRFIIEETPPLQ